MPKSLLGKYASGLLILFLLCLIAVYIGIATGMTPRGSIQAIIIGTSMLITGLATFITGLITRLLQHFNKARHSRRTVANIARISSMSQRARKGGKAYVTAGRISRNRSALRTLV